MEQQLLKEAEDGETFNTRLMIQVLPDTGLKPMQTRTLSEKSELVGYNYGILKL